jgi:sulfatase modifying factor 1
MRLERSIEVQPGKNLAPSRATRDDGRHGLRRMIQRALAIGLAWLTAAMAFGSAFERPAVARNLHAEREPPAAPAANGAWPIPAAAARPELELSPCGEGMVLVEGSYCTDVQHRCKRWLDDEKLPFARCGDYYDNPRCAGERVKLRFCIDRYEYTPEGQTLPANHASFNRASSTCRELGKRICTESEWNFACEGEQMRPYPYGFSRRPVCNQDVQDLYEVNQRRQVLRDLREPADARPECVSPFGVHNMVGNMDEPVLRQAAKDNPPFRNALKGGWWMPARNRCRPSTTAHDDHYEGIQVGIRCCSDAAPAEADPSG